jgi:5-methylcytosine-specific restriction protein A
MNKEGLQRVLDAASARTGLPLLAEADFELANQPIQIRVQGLDSLESFHLKAERSPLTWIIELSFDTFANRLSREVVSLVVKNRVQVSQEIQEIELTGVTVESNIQLLFEATLESLNSQTLFLRLIADRLQKSIDLSENNEEQSLSLLIEGALRLIDSIFILSMVSNDMDETGDSEGERKLSMCSKYERSPKNRIKCLNHYGSICQACGLDPEVKYGVVGVGIIHVHHLVPLSLMNGPTVVNPIRDLVPLCPNCHNFAHKRNPPFTIDEMRSILSRKS